MELIQRASWLPMRGKGGLGGAERKEGQA